MGTGTDVSIAELAELVAQVVGYDGPIVWDRTKPDGTPKELLDVTKINHLRWSATILIDEGVASTYSWILEHHAEARGL